MAVDEQTPPADTSLIAAETAAADLPPAREDAADVATLPVNLRQADPYQLPPHLDEVATAKLRAGAIQFMDMDGEWDYELKAAAAFFDTRFTTAEIVERVTLTPDDRNSTPFRYFTDAARQGGLDEGKRAYRDATVRRLMFEIATAPDFARARVNLDLE